MQKHIIHVMANWFLYGNRGIRKPRITKVYSHVKFLSLDGSVEASSVAISPTTKAFVVL
uniref:Uncharacterized protein n=1 Tax=Nelumbo nucifera TaxID=4432 RepID=A0A823A0D4_NELNU|nr:TPA_asm: hypothetical protein HUJ06_018983 [Nelumbo nucifera]